MKELIEEISTSFDVEIIEQETDRDHIHVLFSCTPKISPTQYIRSLKAKTALILRKEYPQLHKYLWKMLSDHHLTSYLQQDKSVWIKSIPIIAARSSGEDFQYDLLEIISKG